MAFPLPCWTLLLWCLLISTMYGHGHAARSVMDHAEDQDMHLTPHLDESQFGLLNLDELQIGKTFSFQFPVKDNSPFLPKIVADSIPFKLSEFPNILQQLSITPGSSLAKKMEETLKFCEPDSIQGETKKCVTSSESLLEFLHRAFGPGTDFEVLTTTSPVMSSSKFTVLDAPMEIESPKKVICHPLPYAYKVLTCHYFASEIRAFKVSLGLENGENVESCALCHMDTSTFDPNDKAFRILGIKHGQPICHFVPPGNLLWVQAPIKTRAI